MRHAFLGQDVKTGEDVKIPLEAFSTHLHLVGGTGKGKTTAIHTLLHPLLSDPFNPSCFFVIDRLGNFSQELLLWMASRFCPEYVRERLVYIQGAREDFVPTFNPLQYTSPEHGYYKVERATEIILRAWESVNIEAMPRLARWTFNAFWAAAQLGLTIADCVHFLMPGSPYHCRLLAMLPDRLRAEWDEIVSSRGQEATRILDSSRNRLKPYFESDLLRRMFGGTQSRLDVERMMREGKIVVVDLAPRNRLSSQLANTIGALLINEVLATARSLPRAVRYPTYLLLDEFQNFVGPDIESALPEVRQLGLRLILSHQSFSQLERGDYDLTNMIFQAQTRMVFGVQGLDADILAHEVASITYDSRRIKEEIYSRRQLVKGHRKVILSSWGESTGATSQRSETFGTNRSSGRGEAGKAFTSDPTITSNRGESESEGRSRSDSDSYSSTKNQGETLVPIYDEFRELASRTYETFEEQKSEWAREIRNLPTGHALLRLVNDPRLRLVKVKRSTPGFLAYDSQTIARRFPEVFDDMDRMIEENFRSDFFMPAADVDREQYERLERLLKPRIVVDGRASGELATSPTKSVFQI